MYEQLIEGLCEQAESLDASKDALFDLYYEMGSILIYIKAINKIYE